MTATRTDRRARGSSRRRRRSRAPASSTTDEDHGGRGCANQPGRAEEISPIERDRVHIAAHAPTRGTPTRGAITKATPTSPGTTGRAQSTVSAHIRGESPAEGGTRRSRNATAPDATRPNAMNNDEKHGDVQEAVAQDHEVGVRRVDHVAAREGQQEATEHQPSSSVERGSQGRATVKAPAPKIAEPTPAKSISPIVPSIVMSPTRCRLGQRCHGLPGRPGRPAASPAGCRSHPRARPRDRTR